MSDDHLDGHAYMLQMANEISRLRADNERLTRERGEARGESLRWQNGCNAALDRAEAAERKVEKLREAIEAHGMLPNGFCVCSKDRDGEKSNHQPECRDLRAALDETEDRHE